MQDFLESYMQLSKHFPHFSCPNALRMRGFIMEIVGDNNNFEASASPPRKIDQASSNRISIEKAITYING